ncbi:2-phospho-L-lactate transferase [Nesterenkonia salmonea]|uniref:2-phospho-L-lactate transferase n=1 Tax=Nesterenkonia salmonea TaxID=1804987 RepID=A0A5R9BLS3_9MICC|nr:2-phospho-L-lactate transferase [Nesterenkonia salmonea]TLQ01100.1 2-phospho-L-lactate transferase [Nesterenkonia salmonea]
MKVTLISGGVGGAKFALGLRQALQDQDASLSIIVNTGDDMWLTGVRVCPDLDSMMYALAGLNDAERGWGRAGESERVSAELKAYGIGWPWFTLGDLDLGTHLARTTLLREGLALSEATAQLCARWELGAQLIPATDDEVETWVETTAGNGTATMHFEEWWVRTRATAPVRRFLQRGAESASPAAGVVEAVAEADVVVLAPSNPVVSLGTVLGFPGAGGRAGVPGIAGIRQAVQRTAAPVVGVSPIIGGSPVRGMAAQCLEALGQPCSAEAVGLIYGSRGQGGLLDSWLVDTEDSGALPALEASGIAAEAVPLWMHNGDASRRLALDALSAAQRAAGH